KRLNALVDFSVRELPPFAALLVHHRRVVVVPVDGAQVELDERIDLDLGQRYYGGVAAGGCCHSALRSGKGLMSSRGPAYQPAPASVKRNWRSAARTRSPGPPRSGPRRGLRSGVVRA